MVLTGVTGFLGKVILEGLLRRQEAHPIPNFKVILLIRDSAKLTAKERFEKLRNSKCFSCLTGDWTEYVEVVVGDLQLPRCGLEAKEYTSLCRRSTHIIHCAASVDFNLPLEEAASANVETCLNILHLAENCSRLQRLVLVSTAYVTPHTEGQISQTLAPLPMAADKLLARIQAGLIDEKQLLEESGHPNTYTLTKCIAEHLVNLYGSHLPVTIVRPSIISAAWQYPFPGWIDSRAALGGFAALFGAGFLHVMEGSDRPTFDIIPVDIVADHTIAESLLPFPAPADGMKIPSTRSGLRVVHSVAGLKNSCLASDMISAGLKYFGENVVVRPPSWSYMGPRNLKYYWYQLISHQIPLRLASLYYLITNNTKMRRRVQQVAEGIRKINQCFPYFCNHTYDFHAPRGLGDNFTPHKYIGIIGIGVHKHLLLGQK